MNYYKLSVVVLIFTAVKKLKPCGFNLEITSTYVTTRPNENLIIKKTQENTGTGSCFIPRDPSVPLFLFLTGSIELHRHATTCAVRNLIKLTIES